MSQVTVQSREPTHSTADKGAEPSEPVAAKAEAKALPVQPETAPGGGVTMLGQSPEVYAGALALVVVCLGLWWMCRAPPDCEGQLLPADVPQAPEVETSTQATEQGGSLPSDAAKLGPGCVKSSISRRHAAEVIFENAPQDSQVWDMSASVRGVQGGVSEKVNIFER
mmetsp:Transcript_33153/g.74516  ORF Transcript_33153/g.74516 Transcript_33153/m.74516 type:complete len:167 (-) Transcript_33153:140-640(-)